MDHIRIWGHRGCCYAFPENTIESFTAAAKLKGITGVELDVQLTSDGQLVVIHDEKLDRTTTGSGYVKDHTLAEIQSLRIRKAKDSIHVPSLKEVFDALKPYCMENGLLINIELKNSIVPYEGLEEKVAALVKDYALESCIVYSSFQFSSMGKMKKLLPDCKTGILDTHISICRKEALNYGADALHPDIAGLEGIEDVRGWTIRAYNCIEPFFGQDDRPFPEKTLDQYEALGVTDIFTNIPEFYLNKNFDKL